MVAVPLAAEIRIAMRTSTEAAMTSGLFSATTIPVLEQVANFSESRHNLLAANVANIDTPGYIARDMSTDLFQTRLKEAIETRHSPASLGTGGTTDDNDLASLQESDAFDTILRHDGGKVSLEQQVAELTKNQMQYNTALSVMTQQFHLLEAAISEKA
jgi:flagellar basal-body rod protein FlgB